MKKIDQTLINAMPDPDISAYEVEAKAELLTRYTQDQIDNIKYWHVGIDGKWQPDVERNKAAGLRYC
jgi:hypothetical protein